MAGGVDDVQIGGHIESDATLIGLRQALGQEAEDSGIAAGLDVQRDAAAIVDTGDISRLGGIVTAPAEGNGNGVGPVRIGIGVTGASGLIGKRREC